MVEQKRVVSKEELERALNQVEREQFLAWREHPVTEALLTYLHNKREDLKEMWADGAFAAPSTDEMAIRNAAAQGAASVLDDLLNLDEVTLRGNDE